MQSVVQKVDIQWNANEYQRILNDALNREGREIKIPSICENVVRPFWAPAVASSAVFSRTS
jgi:hypothetical protein